MRRRSFIAGLVGAASRGADAGLGTVAYVRQDGLWFRELPGGGARRLVSGDGISSPRFSPSGKWIAYLQRDATNVVSVEGGRPARLGPGGCQWSPFGDLLVEAQDRLNVFHDANGWRSPVRHIPAGLPVVFSPDGKSIAYGARRLSTLALDKSQSNPKVLFDDQRNGTVPCCWTQGGEYVLFWKDPSFSESIKADGLELFRIPAAGGAPQTVGMTTLVHDDMLSFSPRGDKLAVCAGAGRNTWEAKRIAVIDLPSIAIRYLTGESMAAICPAWSPDASTIAFSAAPVAPHIGGGDDAKRALGKRRICTVDAAGANAPRHLTVDDSYRDEEPMWSADGRHILFGRIAAGDDSHTLWLMDAAGSDARQVAGPLHVEGNETWFGYYGYVDWLAKVDWSRSR